MTPSQEKKFDQMHEVVIRLEATLVPRVENLEHSYFGNGKPGTKEEVALLKQSCSDCRKRQNKPRQWPAIVSSVCALGMFVWVLITGK
jgi:hypothetical protein